MAGRFRLVKTAFLGLLLVLIVCSRPLLSQYNTASLGGTVLDTSGASVPKATVTVQNKDTGIAKTTSTGADAKSFSE